MTIVSRTCFHADSGSCERCPRAANALISVTLYLSASSESCARRVKSRRVLAGVLGALYGLRTMSAASLSAHELKDIEEFTCQNS